ncbi:hypothetical protein INR49_007225 [Caranx melampygus]|nr:hypothetical protein INR49_007225 [Caranx melampygus]
MGSSRPSMPRDMPPPPPSFNSKPSSSISSSPSPRSAPGAGWAVLLCRRGDRALPLCPPPRPEGTTTARLGSPEEQLAEQVKPVTLQSRATPGRTSPSSANERRPLGRNQSSTRSGPLPPPPPSGRTGGSVRSSPAALLLAGQPWSPLVADIDPPPSGQAGGGGAPLPPPPMGNGFQNSHHNQNQGEFLL